MQTDKQLFEETKQTAETLLLSKAENDEELMAYLEKQDLSTLNRLKVYFSGFFFMFYLIFSFLWIVKMLISSRKGPMQTILHFQKRAEYSRITGMIDFILDERFKKEFN
ncbi:hypothetical protein DT075_36195 [Bacillus licheniformis]|nr:hypothetical protein DT075_36195 [Bacillus licheniformis]